MSRPAKPRSTAPADRLADVQAITDLTLTVFRLNGGLLHWGDILVEPLGLTSARWQMLGAIALSAIPLTAPQIANAMGVTRQGAQKQLNLLVELGLSEAKVNPSHRRSPVYSLTERGRRVYGEADQLWAAKAAELSVALGAANTRAAKVTLDAMLDLIAGSQ